MESQIVIYRKKKKIIMTTIDDLNRIEAKQLLGSYETNIKIKNLIYRFNLKNI